MDRNIEEVVAAALTLARRGMGKANMQMYEAHSQTPLAILAAAIMRAFGAQAIIDETENVK